MLHTCPSVEDLLAELGERRIVRTLGLVEHLQHPPYPQALQLVEDGVEVVRLLAPEVDLCDVSY
jgi:hypothetical protein